MNIYNKLYLIIFSNITLNLHKSINRNNKRLNILYNLQINTKFYNHIYLSSPLKSELSTCSSSSSLTFPVEGVFNTLLS